MRRHDHKDSAVANAKQRLWGYSSTARLMTQGEVGLADDSQKRATGYVVQSRQPQHLPECGTAAARMRPVHRTRDLCLAVVTRPLV